MKYQTIGGDVEKIASDSGVNLDTYSAVAQRFAADIRAFMVANPGIKQYVIKEVWLVDFGAGNLPPFARLNMSQTLVEFNCSSKMVLQNRTLGEAASDTQADDITNNPGS